eukprot:9169841-Pyramimonas_sp.AAC.1
MCAVGLIHGVGGAPPQGDARLHPSVRFARFASDRALSFVPPDGNFMLMQYKYAPAPQATQPIQPIQSIQPIQPIQSIQSVQPIKSIQPIQSNNITSFYGSSCASRHSPQPACIHRCMSDREGRQYEGDGGADILTGRTNHMRGEDQSDEGTEALVDAPALIVGGGTGFWTATRRSWARGSLARAAPSRGANTSPPAL